MGPRLLAQCSESRQPVEGVTAGARGCFAPRRLSQVLAQGLTWQWSHTQPRQGRVSGSGHNTRRFKPLPRLFDGPQLFGGASRRFR